MLEEKLVGTLSDYEDITGNLSENKLKSELETIPVEVPIKDHNKLDNRDLENQHPIKAVTGLEKELLNIKTNQNEIVMSIKHIEEKVQNKIRTVKEVPQDMRAGEYIFLEKEEKING